ncbi:MAG: glycosyltransferase [Steroidobacteraceae bacterium]
MEFVSFVPDYWNGPRHNRHYFCLELAKWHKVLFVSPPLSIEKYLTWSKRKAVPAAGTRHVGGNLWTHVSPGWLFTNYRFPWLDRQFRGLRSWLLKRAMRKLGFEDPVLLIWHPAFLEMLDAFRGRPSIYYIYDHLSGYGGSDPKQRWPRELELLRRCDMVFALSRKLLEENRPYNSNIFLLPNAVDFDHFSRARDESTEVPADLAAIPGPRIGYVGSINEKVDLGLLETMARQRPGWSIVLIGRQNFATSAESTRFDELIAQPNVHWIPYRNPETLPAYLKGLDVCLMCYVINGWTYFGDPSKMHEYLAAGKPTIGAPLPAILEFADVIEVPRSQSEWLEAVARSLQPGNSAAIERRVQVARQNSYSERIRAALTIIGEKFPGTASEDSALRKDSNDRLET